MNLAETLHAYIVAQRFNNQPPADFDADYDLINTGVMDSLAIINTVTFLEQEYGIEFGENDIVPEHFISVNALVAFVASKQTA